MTLRDLTKRQLYNLRRRCEKLRKEWWMKPETAQITTTIFESHKLSWNAGFNAGFKTGLEQQSK